MGQEINLLDAYPAPKRDLSIRAGLTDAERGKARKFGWDYFDGDRRIGYGGYQYDPIYWTATVRRMRDHYRLAPIASILDVGCGRGFMLSDFKRLMQQAYVRGVDGSVYAIESAKADVKNELLVRGANNLWGLDCFDLVVSINTVHNLPLIDCKEALREIERVRRKQSTNDFKSMANNFMPPGHAYVTVDAWRTDEEKERMLAWNVTALTYMHVDDWKQLFDDVGYTGDYWWFIP